MKQNKTINWIPEKVAASMLGLTPGYFRRQCKDNKLPIPLRNTNGRNYQYSKDDIERYRMQTSTVV